MKIDNNILLELKEISPIVANLEKHQIFITPPDYFNNLAGEILALIKQDEFFSKAKYNPYVIPNGYFTELAEKITAKTSTAIKTENEVACELNEIAPLLTTISKQNIYSVPNNYFEQNNFAQKTQEPAKVISFKKASKWFNYAVAAIIMVVIGIGTVKYMGAKHTHFVLENEVAKATDAEITNYLENQPHSDNSTTNFITDEHEAAGLFEGTSTDELKQYLNEQPETPENSNKNI
jgi:hypothetical protein